MNFRKVEKKSLSYNENYYLRLTFDRLGPKQSVINPKCFRVGEVDVVNNVSLCFTLDLTTDNKGAFWLKFYKMGFELGKK